MTTANQGQIVEFGSHLVKRAEWIAPPSAVSWFPQTFAWQMIALALIVSAMAYAVYRYHQYLKYTYLREAHAYYLSYSQQHQYAKLAQLMKQLASQHWPQASLGTLDSAAFAHFIASQEGAKLTPEQIIELFSVSYQSTTTLAPETQQAIHQWFEEITC
ncbi:DUF4381 domain-containing protein [Vibrio agarivorans]|uniref:DUF4381 domain-containing protein n=1 Tax=Vibrio agarivorans TaxID=153622 RepID=A0ABT7Y405_9VIBR|nr:DUF4381 domain-containing protein [Vibrio agarivorans]MDN2482716.1 DUF4381 domain-containing protein [Vibrio agarivorans]